MARGLRFTLVCALKGNLFEISAKELQNRQPMGDFSLQARLSPRQAILPLFTSAGLPGRAADEIYRGRPELEYRSIL